MSILSLSSESKIRIRTGAREASGNEIPERCINASFANLRFTTRHLCQFGTRSPCRTLAARREFSSRLTCKSASVYVSECTTAVTLLYSHVANRLTA